MSRNAPFPSHPGFLLLSGILVALLAVPRVAAAQGTPLGPVEMGVLKYLLELPDPDIPVRYTPGALDRAARLQDQVRRVLGDLYTWSGAISPQVVLILSPKEWQELGIDGRYGYPTRLSPTITALPAWGTEETVTLWKGLLGGSLPSVDDFSARGTPEEVASVALADAIFQLELCREVSRRLNLAGGEDGVWLSDVLAHLFSVSSDRKAPFPPSLDLAAVLAARSTESKPASLQAYGAGLDGAAWMSFQAAFSQAAVVLWSVKGKKAVRRILRLRRKKEQPLVFDNLLKDFPAAASWRQEWP